MNSMLPSIEIDDDVIDLEETDVIPTTTWDEKIRTMLTKGMDGKVPLDDLLKLYTRSLRDQMRVSKDKKLLRDKILTHLNYFHIHYMEMNDILNLSSYYELIEDVLAHYCSLELDLLRWKYQNRIKREKPEMKFVKSALHRICGNLTTFLNGREAHIVHVLLKIRYRKFSEETNELLLLLYNRMLFGKPLSDSTDEDLCRLWIVFQKVKEVVEPPKLQEIEKVFAAKYGAVELSRSSEAVQYIFYVNKNGSRVANLLHIKDRVVQNYFRYLKMKKLKEEETFVDAGSHGLCDTFEEETLYEKAFGRNLHMVGSPPVCSQNSDSSDEVVILSDNEEPPIPKKVDKKPKKVFENVTVCGDVIELGSDDDEDCTTPTSHTPPNSLTSKFPSLNINDLASPEKKTRGSVTNRKKSVTVSSDPPEIVTIMDTETSETHDTVTIIDADECVETNESEGITVNSDKNQIVTVMETENECSSKTYAGSENNETVINTEKSDGFTISPTQSMANLTIENTNSNSVKHIAVQTPVLSTQTENSESLKADNMDTLKSSNSVTHQMDIAGHKPLISKITDSIDTPKSIPTNNKQNTNKSADGKNEGVDEKRETVKINGLSVSEMLINAVVTEKTNADKISAEDKTNESCKHSEKLVNDIKSDVRKESTEKGHIDKETVNTHATSTVASDITLKMMLDTLGVAIDTNGSPNPIQEKIKEIKLQLEENQLSEKEAFKRLVDEIKGTLSKKIVEEHIEYQEVKEENDVDDDFSIQFSSDLKHELNDEELLDDDDGNRFSRDVRKETTSTSDLLSDLVNESRAANNLNSMEFIKAPLQFQKKSAEVNQDDLMEVFSANEDNLESFLDNGANLENLDVGGLENILSDSQVILESVNVPVKNQDNLSIENTSRRSLDKNLDHDTNNYSQKSKLVNGLLTPNTSEGKAEEENLYMGTNKQNAQESTDYEDSLYESYSDISTPDLKEKDRRKANDPVSILQTLKVTPNDSHKKADDVPLFSTCDNVLASVTLNDFNKQKTSAGNLSHAQSNSPKIVFTSNETIRPSSGMDGFDEFQESLSGSLTKINGSGHHYNYNFFDCERAVNFQVNKVNNAGIVEDRWLKTDSCRADMGSKQSYQMSSASSSPLSNRSFDEIPKADFLVNHNAVRKTKEPKGILINKTQTYPLPVASLLFDLEEDAQASYERQDRAKRKLTDSKDKAEGQPSVKKKKVTLTEPVDKIKLVPRVELENYSHVDLIKLHLKTVNDKVLNNHITKKRCIITRVPLSKNGDETEEEEEQEDVVASPSRVPDPEEFLKENPVTERNGYVRGTSSRGRRGKNSLALGLSGRGRGRGRGTRGSQRVRGRGRGSGRGRGRDATITTIADLFTL